MTATTTPAKSHECTVVHMKDDQLTTKTAGGKEQCHSVGAACKVTHDGKACKAIDLKAGATVRVTPHKDDATVATHIESGAKITIPTAKA